MISGFDVILGMNISISDTYLYGDSFNSFNTARIYFPIRYEVGITLLFTDGEPVVSARFID